MQRNTITCKNKRYTEWLKLKSAPQTFIKCLYSIIIYVWKALHIFWIPRDIPYVIITWISCARPLCYYLHISSPSFGLWLWYLMSVFDVVTWISHVRNLYVVTWISHVRNLYVVTWISYFFPLCLNLNISCLPFML